METWGTQKQIYIDDPQMNVVVIGNFNVVEEDTYTGFQHTAGGTITFLEIVLMYQIFI